MVRYRCLVVNNESRNSSQRGGAWQTAGEGRVGAHAASLTQVNSCMYSLSGGLAPLYVVDCAEAISSFQ